MEIWKDCLDLPFYQVSNMGNVRSLDRFIYSKDGKKKKHKGRVLKLANLNGYLTFGTSSPRKINLVHREVLKSFIGPQPKGMQACHENGIRSDNRIENLRWDTPLNNTHDKFKHKTMQIGEFHPMAKISDKQAEEIRNSQLSTKELMKIYGLSLSHTQSIRAKRYRNKSL